MAHAKSTDPNVFILPDLGEGVHEAELIKWRVSPGDTVAEHDILAEMETDKALVEVPSPRAGVIQTLHGQEGEILKVGEPLVTYQGGSGEAEQPRAEQAAATATSEERGGRQAAKADPQPALSASGAAEEEREDAGTVVGNLSAGAGVSHSEGRALATPAVRRLARDLGVDIDRVPGSGIAGRVTERDVRAAAGGGNGQAAPQPKAAPQGQPAGAPSVATEATVADENAAAALATRVAASAPVPATPGAERIPFRGTRRTIAGRLRQSIDTAVHFTVMDEAEVSALDAVRKRTAASSGEKLSYLPFVISALCRAVKKFPALNATVDDPNEQIVRHKTVHMGIATDTEHGLNVPVIPDADTLGVLELGRAIAELARQARERSIPRDRLMGSTITISNVGSYAGRFATPVINYPEVAILAVGRVHEGVVAENGAIRVGKLLPLSFACDHRVVDGAEGARCLAHLIDLLSKPEELLTPARA